MNSIERGHRDLRYMDTLAQGTSPLHRLDPMALLLVTLLFIGTVISFGKYTLSALLPFFLYPVAMISLGGLPAGYFLKKVLLVSPFALLVGIFNPILDREVMLYVGHMGISGGWISFFSILLKFFLTVLAAFVLIALTGFNALCRALRRLKVPKPFVIQLLFFYRYLFVLVGEGERMERARALRSANGRTMPLKVLGAMLGHLLLRSFDRAERIYLAMRCRGFDGDIPLIRTIAWSRYDTLLVAVWGLLFLLFRAVNLPEILGNISMEIFR